MRYSVSLALILAFSLIMLQPDPVSAQAKRKYSFFVAGEYAFATSPEEFTDYYSGGFGFGLGLEYPVSPNWSIIGLFDLKLFSPASGTIEGWWTDEGEWPGATNIKVSEGSLTAGSIAFLGKGCLKTEGSRLFPYIKGGFGITIAGADEIKVDFTPSGSSGTQTEWVAGAGSETNISIFFGLGVEKLLGTGNSSLFLDAGLHMIMQEEVNPTVAPITLGFKF